MGVINSQRATTGLIHKYLGSSYDTVKLVADSIEDVNALADVLGDNVDFALLADVLTNLGDSVADLAALAVADLENIASDLEKGNYLGNRKIDIDLSLNNQSTDTEVTYQGLTIVTTDGVSVPVNFTVLDGNGDPIINELASYAAIFSELKDGITAYNASEPDSQLHILDTEIDIINSTLPDKPTMIRIRDTDGSASKIERVIMHSYNGQPIYTDPEYYWAKTTSALQTLANRVGDIISLGNDIDSIIQLATQKDEINYLYSKRTELLGVSNSIYSELNNLLAVHSSLSSINNVNTNMADIQSVEAALADIDVVVTNLLDIQNAYQNAQDAINAASASANSATDSQTYATSSMGYRDTAQTLKDATQTLKNETEAIRTAIQNITVLQTITGAAGTSASVVYDGNNNEFTFIVPQGDKGDKGDSFTVNAVGQTAERALYDAQIEGFSFLDTTTAQIYFKVSATSGDWSTGAPFGKGDQGDPGATGNGIASVTWTSTTGVSAAPNEPGETDTYTVTYDNAGTATFTVYNGTDFSPTDLIDDTQALADKTWSSNKITTELGTKKNAPGYVVSAGSRTLQPGESCYFSSTGTATLPLTPTDNTEVEISGGNFATLIVARNGELLMGLSEDMTLNVTYPHIKLRFVNSGIGWRLVA